MIQVINAISKTQTIVVNIPSKTVIVRDITKYVSIKVESFVFNN